MRRASLLGDGALIVLRNVGLLLLYISPLPLGLLPVAIYYGETQAWGPIVLMVLTFLFSGFLLSRLPAPREPRLREGMLIAAVGWLAVPAGSIVLFTTLEGWAPLDAYFEAMSAWSGTGMSLADVTVLSKTALFWRTLMQWIGGLGVIVLTLAILARPGTGAHTLYVSEAREDKLRPSVLSTVRTLWRIYTILSVASIGMLLVAGLPLWQAINHALTGIATGGMSINPNSVAEFSVLEQLALIPIMIIGSMPFVATYALFRGRWPAFLKDVQVRALIIVVALGVPFIAWTLLRDPLIASERTAWVEAAFQVVSAVSTTGFQSVNFTNWTPAAKVGLAGIMLLGGAAGSTAGGIKLFRGVLLMKGALWKLRRSGLPHFAVTSFRFGGERLDESEANEEFAEAAFIVILSVAALFVGAIALFILLPGAEPLDVLFELASTQGNNGMSVGIVNPAMPDGAKIALVIVMWAARLEILPVLLLLRGLLPRPANS